MRITVTQGETKVSINRQGGWNHSQKERKLRSVSLLYCVDQWSRRGKDIAVDLLYFRIFISEKENKITHNAVKAK